MVLADLGLPAGAGGRPPARGDRPAARPLPGLAVVGLCEAGDEKLVARRCGRARAAAWTPARTARSWPGPSSRPAAARRSCPARRSQQLHRGLREDGREPALTERERQVRGLMEQGLPDKVIAERLVLSVKTVEKHAGAVLRKTGARNRTELAALRRAQAAAQRQAAAVGEALPEVGDFHRCRGRGAASSDVPARSVSACLSCH